ncbi:MAG TPA: NAD(P)/FAD-dependent oxidoreductase [Candidatus Nanopelagicaceae bacterium]|nr:NAD(P)/FAD-dependent oxidoreductase [Candidatus Nanopelagicaceae bacterium]
MKVIIIGSGLAGLTAASYMCREGHDVVIYEQFSEIGGVTATIHKDGYSWDIGPLLLEGLAPHEKLGKILAELGIADKVSIIHEDRGQILPDFAIWRPKEYKGRYWRKEFFKEIFPSESEGLDRYYRFYDQIMTLMAINNRLEWAKGLEAIWLKLKIIPKFMKVKKYMDKSAADIMDSFFNDPKLKAVFMGILADFVVKPSEFPGLGVPISNVETAFDKRIPLKIKGGKLPVYHYIQNGCEQLVNAFASYIKENGGKIHIDSLVEKILIENNKAVGVKLKSGQEISADIVIASGGAHKTFFSLVGKENLPSEFGNNVQNLVHMESVLMVHIGIDFDPTPHQRAALCYYYGTYDIEGAVNRCRSGDYHEGKEGFLIYVPSLHSPEMAPHRHHAVTIYTITPYILSKGDWVSRREELADKLLIEAEKIIPGLREHAKTKVIMTPLDFKSRIFVERHSFGGLAPIMNQQNPPHHTPIQGLWYVGAQSESGGGVAGVVAGTRRGILKLLKEI